MHKNNTYTVIEVRQPTNRLTCGRNNSATVSKDSFHAGCKTSHTYSLFFSRFHTTYWEINILKTWKCDWEVQEAFVQLYNSRRLIARSLYNLDHLVECEEYSSLLQAD